jgi:hypothetical protein
VVTAQGTRQFCAASGGFDDVLDVHERKVGPSHIIRQQKCGTVSPQPRHDLSWCWNVDQHLPRSFKKAKT